MIDASYPALGKGNVVFLIDASNEVEQRLLESHTAEIVAETKDIGATKNIVVPIQRDPENVPLDHLLSLIEEQDKTLLVPIRVVWAKSEMTSSGPRLSDIFKWKQVRPDSIQAAKIISRSPERAIKVIGNAASLADLKKRLDESGGDHSNPKQLATYIASQAALALDVAERKYTGGRYKVPLRVANSIKSDKKFRQALSNLSLETGTSLSNLEQEADTIMKEMIATPSPFWLDLGSGVAKKLTSMAYDSEIVLNQEDVARTKEIVNNYPTAFLWTHKTHVDGMAMQKVLYENNFPPAHTFGGINMAFAGVGYASRRSGVIFIRRTFHDNPLYKLVLRHYIGFLLEKRFPFSWAFEGTRSRVGKLMPPRYGLLKYLIEAAQTTSTKNLHIVPVAINYDVIGDAEDYAIEQAGESKRAENLSWFLGYVRGMRQPMGRIYMDFGKPVVLSEVPNADDRIALAKVAFQVGVEVNRVTPITIASVATMVLLSAIPKALTSEELTSSIKDIVDWARRRDIRISSDFQVQNRQQSEKVIDILIRMNLITRYDEASTSLFSISPEQHVVASYYRNTTVHYFVNKSIAELALLAVASDPDSGVEGFWKEAEWLRDLFKYEFFYSPKDEFREEITAELNKYDPHWAKSLSTDNQYSDQLLRRFLPLFAHATLTQFAEAYWVACTVLMQNDSGSTVEEKSFVTECIAYGRQAYLQRRIRSKASIGKELFNNGFKLLQNLDLTENNSDVENQRKQAQKQFRSLINRLERIRSRALPL